MQRRCQGLERLLVEDKESIQFDSLRAESAKPYLNSKSKYEAASDWQFTKSLALLNAHESKPT